MIPAFRHALFSWEYNPDLHGEAERCLSRQLQKLFAQLQLSSRAAVTTGALTRSFGWTSADAFVQQDVTECFTVLMSFLESQSIGSYIASAHRGELHDYLCCSKCGDQRGRNEVYQDIHLEVKGHTSVEAMLLAHGSEEDLEGVECSACHGKHNHRKGISLTALPDVLMLHLKRFTLDYTTWQRVKLNDEVTIPLVLNMEAYVRDSKERPNSELMYELASILVHVGGAHSGHYYCVVHDPVSKAWFKFNDATVTAVSEDELNSILISNNTGYGLVYRRASSASILSVGPAIIPDDIRREIDEENAAFEVAKAEWEEKQKWAQVLVYGPWEASSGSSGLSVLAATKSLSIHKERTTPMDLLTQAAETVREKNPDVAVCLADGRLRLRVFDKAKNLALMPLDCSLNELPESFLTNPLLLEIRPESTQFESFAADGLALQLIQVAGCRAGESGVELSFHDPVQFSISASATVGHLREAISARLEVALTNTQVVLFQDDSPMALQDDAQLLKDVSITTGDTLHVDDECRNDKSTSRLLSYFEVLAHSITVYFNDLKKTSEAPEIRSDNAPENNPLTSMMAVLNAKSRAAESRKSVRIDGRVPLRSLKDKIGALIGLSVGEFTVKRSSGQELKDLDLELSSGYGLTDGVCLEVALGAPMKAGEYRFRFALSKDDSSHTSLGALVVSASQPVADVKRALFDAFGESHSVPPPDRMRLRKATSTAGVVRLLKVLEDGPEQTLEMNFGEAIADGKLIGIQETSGQETFTSEMMLLRCRLWQPTLQELGPVDEIGVLREATFDDLKTQLVAKLPANEVNASATTVALAKPFSYLLQDLANFASLKWAQQPRSEAKLCTGPPRLVDGDLIVFKDSRDAEKVGPGPTVSLGGLVEAAAQPGARSRAEPAFQLFTPAEQATREAERLASDEKIQEEAAEQLEEIRSRLVKERVESGIALNEGERQSETH